MTDLDEAYREYAHIVYGYLRSLCRDDDLAEELTQETFYQAVRSSPRFDGSCRVSTWLCQIAKHLWYRELERRRRRGTLPLEEEQLPPTVSTEEDVLRREDALRLYRRSHALTEPAREVFLLRAAGELSFREIGEIFGRSENWARVTFYRAKQKVTEGWEHDEL